MFQPVKTEDEIETAKSAIFSQMKIVGGILKIIENPDFRGINEIMSQIQTELLDIARLGEATNYAPLARLIPVEHALKALNVIEEINKRVANTRGELDRLVIEYNKLEKEEEELKQSA